MEFGSGAVAAITLGFLLGLKHATDADHVVAVATIVSEFKNAFRSLWVGASWGIGHTVPLLILGTIILAFKEVVMESYEDVASYFEFGVGVMLVFLGLQVYWTLRKGRLHIHHHDHDGDTHLHIHGTHEAEEAPTVQRQHGIFNPGKPFFRMKSFVIGLVHGLAGSAAVMLALLPTIDSFFAGLAYLLLFGVGTVLSMSIITIVLSVPFAVSGSYENLNRIISGVAGSVSIFFGIALMSDISFGTALVPF